MDIPGISRPFADRLTGSAHHIFPVLLECADQRPAFRQALGQQGIQTSVHYPPVHQFSHYLDRCPQPAPLAVTEDVSSREVTLPLHPLLEISDVRAICDVVHDAIAART